jgi:hypothetical protein
MRPKNKKPQSHAFAEEFLGYMLNIISLIIDIVNYLICFSINPTNKAEK